MDVTSIYLNQRKKYMATEQLEILREFPFEFYGETYRAYLGTDRNLYLRVADISQSMGLDYPGQLRRIKNSLPLSRKLSYIEVDTPYQNGIRKRAVAHMNIEGLTYWLATIDTSIAPILFPMLFWLNWMHINPLLSENSRKRWTRYVQ